MSTHVLHCRAHSTFQAASPAVMRSVLVATPVSVRRSCGVSRCGGRSSHVPAAQAGTTQSSPDPPVASRRSMPVLSLLSAAVELQDDTSRFENLAGRAAMCGLTLATLLELSTDQRIFALTGDEVTLAGASALFVITCATLLAVTSKRRFSNKLREAVVTSLTAVKRSAASVTQTQVDKAVDYFFEQALGGFTVFQEEFF